MPLTGTYTRTLDSKLRLALPKTLRDALTVNAATIYVTAEPDGAVGIYSQKEFDARASRLAESTASPGDTRRFMRVYYSQAEACVLDAQGRLRLPQRLAKRAGVTAELPEVCVLGVGDHLEVWSVDVWEKTSAALQDDFERLADETFRRT